jgi:hypothetical protein
MIGKFWDMLFAYADKAKANGDKERYEIVQEIETMLQTAYDLGVSSSSVIVDYRGRGDMERLILSIPDIRVYHDKTDDTVWYELDFEYEEHGGTRRFDTPQEVIKYLIQYRAKSLNRNMGAERAAAIEFMTNRLKKITLSEIYGNPKRIVEVENGKK